MLSSASVLHWWSARQGEVPALGGLPTIVRNSAGTIIDRSGKVISAPPNTPRFGWDLVNSEIRQTLLLEMARTNLVIQSDAITAANGWTVGAGVTPTAAYSSIGITSLTRFAGSNTNDVSRAVTLTGNAAKAMSAIVEFDGSAGTSAVAFYDSTAAVLRFLCVITWAADGSATAAAGAGTLLGFTKLRNGTYRILGQTTSCTAANAHAVYANYAASPTATSVRVGAIEVADGPFPTAIIPTAATVASRSADSLYWDYLAAPQAMAVYVRFVEAGTRLSGNQAWAIVDAAGTGTPNLLLFGGGASAYILSHTTGAGTVTSQTSGLPAIGDVVELLAILFNDGRVQLIQSINGAAVTTGGASAALTLGAAWADRRLWMNSQGALGVGSNRFAEIKAVRLGDVVSLTDQGRMNELRAFDFDGQGNQV